MGEESQDTLFPTSSLIWEKLVAGSRMLPAINRAAVFRYNLDSWPPKSWVSFDSASAYIFLSLTLARAEPPILNFLQRRPHNPIVLPRGCYNDPTVLVQSGPFQ
eukprot:NODE_103_length_19640_cov_0.520905.p13 type:complete len:104 gc:universal NODE_103_length_19640_cov_0.520905:1787-1476(-)